MARKPRIEVDGGLYHLITRGNARQEIFHSFEDHEKFLALLEKQKARFSFFLYAYCLMTNGSRLYQFKNKTRKRKFRFRQNEYQNLGFVLEGEKSTSNSGVKIGKNSGGARRRSRI